MTRAAEATDFEALFRYLIQYTAACHAGRSSLRGLGKNRIGREDRGGGNVLVAYEGPPNPSPKGIPTDLRPASSTPCWTSISSATGTASVALEVSVPTASVVGGEVASQGQVESRVRGPQGLREIGYEDSLEVFTKHRGPVPDIAQGVECRSGAGTRGSCSATPAAENPQYMAPRRSSTPSKSSASGRTWTRPPPPVTPAFSSAGHGLVTGKSAGRR